MKDATGIQFYVLPKKGQHDDEVRRIPLKEDRCKVQKIYIYIDRIGTGTPSSFLKVTGWKLVCSQGLADRKHVCKHFGYFNDSHLALPALFGAAMCYFLPCDSSFLLVGVLFSQASWPSKI